MKCLCTRVLNIYHEDKFSLLRKFYSIGIKILMEMYSLDKLNRVFKHAQRFNHSHSLNLWVYVNNGRFGLANPNFFIILCEKWPLFMEIEKNIICVIKKIAGKIPEHLNLLPVSEICIWKANIFQKFLLCLFWFYLRNIFLFFLVIEKHKLVFKFLCIEQLQIACKFSTE